MSAHSSARTIRAQLDHPVIDGDGHVLEFVPAMLPHLRETLGQPLFDRWFRGNLPVAAITGGSDLDARRATRHPQSAWWATPAANTRDLATAMAPRLLHDRLDELGIDVAVLYPTKGFGIAGVEDDELRAGLCRGFNAYYAETYLPFRDRMVVSGVIPMHTPEEAIAELDHCAELGLSVAAIPEGVRRPIERPEPSPWLMAGQAEWFDTFGLDSAYDYDPVWARFRHHGFAVSCHGGLGHIAPNSFTSISNYVFNHIGSLAEKNHRLCKSLFLGGVTRRFPDLNIAFLECGVGWGATLLADLVEHWEKRNLESLALLDPDRIDYLELEGLLREYAPELLATTNGDTRRWLETTPAVGVPPEEHDEFVHIDVSSPEELVDLFVPRFYFGCEADDRTVAHAFSRANPFGARLRPMFSSDIAHWDVTDMASVVPEAHELVEDGVLTEDDFRDFMFANPARLFLNANPQFFDGTPVEAHVDDTLLTG